MWELVAAAGWWPIAAAAVGVTLLVVWWLRRGLVGRAASASRLRWMLDNGYELTRALTAETVAMSAAEVDRLATSDRHGPTPVATGEEAADSTPEHVHPRPEVDHPHGHTPADMATPAPANAASDGHTPASALASPVPDTAPVLSVDNGQVGAETVSATPPPRG